MKYFVRKHTVTKGTQKSSISIRKKHKRVVNVHFRINQLRETKRKVDRIRTLAGVFSFFIPPITAILYFINNDKINRNFILAIGIAYSAIFLFMYFVQRSRSREIEADINRLEREKELEYLEGKISLHEQRAEQLFKIHHLQLKDYYDQALTQNKWIFVVGILCIGLGFIIMGVTVYIIGWSSILSGIPEKIVVASLGAIGSLLSEFVAVVYLKMFSGVLGALTEFHNRLVGTHHLHFANFLASRINEDDDRESILGKMAFRIVDNFIEYGIKGKKDDSEKDKNNVSKKTNEGK